MAKAQPGTLPTDVRNLIGTESSRDSSDQQLLERFITRRDEAAFTGLVRRHSNTVWGVCRRVLQQPQDVEDAFQATFLILARKAASIRKGEAVGSWLYGVAYRTALKARQTAARRQAQMPPLEARTEPAASSEGGLPGIAAHPRRGSAAAGGQIPGPVRAVLPGGDEPGRGRPRTGLEGRHSLQPAGPGPQAAPGPTAAPRHHSFRRADGGGPGTQHRLGRSRCSGPEHAPGSAASRLRQAARQSPPARGPCPGQWHHPQHGPEDSPAGRQRLCWGWPC